MLPVQRKSGILVFRFRPKRVKLLVFVEQYARGSLQRHAGLGACRPLISGDAQRICDVIIAKSKCVTRKRGSEVDCCDEKFLW